MQQYSIERVDVRSLASILGSMALAWGVIVSLVWVVVGLAGGPFPGLPEFVSILVGAPIGGIIIGAISAILFNLAVVLVGGLTVEMD